MKNKNDVAKCINDCLSMEYNRQTNEFMCKLYNKKLKYILEKDPYDNGFVVSVIRDKKCVNDETETMINTKIKEIRDTYNVFVFEMDLLFGELESMYKNKYKDVNNKEEEYNEED